MTNYRRRKKVKKIDESRKFKVNSRIRASQIRLINEAGEMLGVMSFDEAEKMALENDLDLIEVNPKAEPPVVKLIDYNKFKYQLSKSSANKPKKNNDEKTFRVSVRVAINDLTVRAKKIDQLLQKGSKIKLQVQMKGREKAYPEVAEEVMNKFLSSITEAFLYESEPKLTGDSYYATIKAKSND